MMADKELEGARRAVERTPPQDPDRARRMKDLGAQWRRQVLASGDVAELDRAIDYFRAARGAAGTALAQAEYNLAVLVSDRYDISGDPADLTEATGAAQRALDALPAGAGDRYDYLAMLAFCQWEWYDARGVLADLDRAISLGTQAVAAVPPGARLWSRLNSNLGMMLLDRYERASDAADLDRAIDLAAAAVDAASADDGERPGWRNNLANALRLRFEARIPPGDLRPGDAIDISDLAAAIGLYEEALGELAAGPSEVERALILSNLGEALLDRAALHELAGEDDAAATVYGKALAAHEAAVAATPAAAPDRAGRLSKLAAVQRSLARRTATASDVDAARTTFREACELGLAAAPEMALSAAADWATWEVSRQDWEQAVIADRYALRAAEALHRSQQGRSDRETWLMASRGLAADAAYAAVQEGDLPGAVARLERGRAILLADALDLVPAALTRLPDADLVRRYAEAAQRVREASG